MSAVRTPSRPAFDYKAPYATALRMALVVAVGATAVLSLATGQDRQGTTRQVTHVVLAPVEIVGHREDLTPIASTRANTTTVASEGAALNMSTGAANRGNLTQ